MVTVKHLPQGLAGTISLPSHDWWLHFPTKISPPLGLISSFPGGSAVKDLPEIQELQEMQTQSLGQEDPLEEEMATQPRILPWNIPWTKEIHALPFDVSSRKLRGRLSGKALPHIFIPGLLLLVVELLNHV